MEVSDVKQTLYIFNCQGSTIQVRPTAQIPAGCLNIVQLPKPGSVFGRATLQHPSDRQHDTCR